MLKKILSISGKPGLYRLLSQAKNVFYVESINDSKRIPVHSRDRVVSLGDIAIYTETEEVSLANVLTSMVAKENGAKASVSADASQDELREYMAVILPEFDRDRVYPSDIKKLIKWYNLLVEANITDFTQKEEEEETEAEVPEAAE